MAPRTQPAEAAPAPDADQVISTLCRVIARMAVRQSVSQGAATFAQIAVRELGVATDAEARVIESWLTAHPAS